MIQIIVLSLALVHIILCYKSLAYGCAMFLFIKLTIPAFSRVGPISLPMFAFVVLTAFIVLRHNDIKRDLRNPDTFLPLQRLLLPLMLLTLFGSLNYFYMYKQLFRFGIESLLPFTAIMLCIKNKQDLKIITWSVMIAFSLIGVWGVITYIIKMNPYVSAFTSIYGYEGETYLGDGFSAQRGSLFGRATGNMLGALSWGGTAIILLSFVAFFPTIKNGILKHYLIILAALNCLLTTKRSSILPMIIGITYFYIIQKGVRLKHFMYCIIGLSLIVITVNESPELKKIYQNNIETALFFWDDNLTEKRGIYGSSMDTRVRQFECAHQLIAFCPLTGRGYGYPSIHSKRYGTLSDILFFEGFYFDAVVSSGFIGVFVWLLFFYTLWKRSKYCFDNKYDGLFYHGLYIIFSFLTGFQSTFILYMIFCGLIFKYKQLFRIDQKNV